MREEDHDFCYIAPYVQKKGQCSEEKPFDDHPGVSAVELLGGDTTVDDLPPAGEELNAQEDESNTVSVWYFDIESV